MHRRDARRAAGIDVQHAAIAYSRDHAVEQAGRTRTSTGAANGHRATERKVEPEDDEIEAVPRGHRPGEVFGHQLGARVMSLGMDGIALRHAAARLKAIDAAG